eukprot:s62_g20.t3
MMKGFNNRNHEAHICLQVCGRPLSCGNHTCEEFCHLGNCPPCRVVVHEPIFCACGKNSIEPPSACGREAPYCQEPCAQLMDCGEHPMCYEPVDRLCLGGHMYMKNKPCHVGSISCGQSCGKQLACGHSCSSQCHAGECKDCSKPCGARRVHCSHTCQAPCHPGSECEDTPCRWKVKQACPCGQRVEERSCGAYSELRRPQWPALRCLPSCERPSLPPFPEGEPVKYTADLFQLASQHRRYVQMLEETFATAILSRKGTDSSAPAQQIVLRFCVSGWKHVRPSVPSSLQTELLDRDWLGPSGRAPLLLSSKPAIKPSIAFTKKPKASLSDSTVQADPVVRRADSRDRTCPEDGFCSNWCGPDCAAHFKEVSLLLTRPTFGRPPQHEGIGAPDGIDFRRREDCDPCGSILWARPSDLPSLPPDSPLDDAADSNRLTSRPKFWWKDLDDDEGLEELVRQIHMPEENPSLWLPASRPSDAPATSPESSPDESHLNHDSPYSLNSILHKPGTRSPSVDQHVTFTVSPDEPKSPHPGWIEQRKSPVSKKGKAVRTSVVQYESDLHLLPATASQLQALPSCDSSRRLLAIEYARLHWRFKTSSKSDAVEGWWQVSVAATASSRFPRPLLSEIAISSGSSVESEDFHIPVPPLTAEPHSPADPVTLLEAKEPKMADAGQEVRPLWRAWNMESTDDTGWRDLCRRQAIELTLTVVALCCWTIMCVLDLFGWQNGLDSESDVASQILSLSSLAVSCIAFTTRPCCVSRILQKDPDGTAGQSRLHYQLLILLASQWSLLCGALIWLVYQASSQRHPQVIAGVVAVFILLILLLCSFVYLLHAQRKRLTTSVDLALASVDPQADWTPDRSYSSTRKPAIEVPERSDDSDDAVSDNYVRVASADDLEDPEQFTNECGMRKQKSDEVLRRSRGRWRPLFPTFMASSLQSPTMSRTSMLSLGAGGEFKRGTSIKSFRFETEKEVEESLEKEIKRHTLEVNCALQRSTSPSPSLGSVPSQQPKAAALAAPVACQMDLATKGVAQVWQINVGGPWTYP